MEKSNHLDWLNKGLWYNTDICSKLNGSLFEDFITNSRTDRYNLRCSIVAHDKKQPDYEETESSIRDRLISKHATTETSEAFGATFNFIEIWPKLLEENYDARRGSYSTAMQDTFKQIPTTMTKPLSQRQKVQELMTKIGGGWYIKK